MRPLLVLLAVFTAVPLAAQVQSRPTDPPLVTAVNESWYQLREPIQFAGELYYPAGATVFFNGNTMVRSGHYNGVPLYTDTTVEPFSIVLVPISRGLLQPYERPRRGDLAGTSGSRPPAFPVHPTPEITTPTAAAVSPTAPPLTPGAIGVFTPESTAPVAARTVAVRDANREGSPRTSEVVGTTGIIAVPRPRDARPIETVRRPESNDGIWIRFGGERWVASGIAVPLSVTEFISVGDYAGVPVYARRELNEEVIYIPTRAGMIAPYRLKE